MNISAVIPAYNEEAALVSTLLSLKSVKDIGEIIVVNDGSSDKTGEIADHYADHAIHMPYNQGKGSALKKGCEIASGDIVLFIDSDLKESAVMSVELMKPVLSGEADMSIAIFPPAMRKGGFGLVKGLARKGIHHLTGYEPSSPLSGQRALNRQAISCIKSWDCGFGIEVGMTIDAVRAGLRVVEIPVAYSHRETSRDLAGFIHRGRQFIAVGRMLKNKWN